MEANLFDQLLEVLIKVSPVIGTVCAIVGLFVTIAIAIDKMIPDEKDHGFMTKLLAVPVLGLLLKALAKCSPMNNKEIK